MAVANKHQLPIFTPESGERLEALRSAPAQEYTPGSSAATPDAPQTMAEALGKVRKGKVRVAVNASVYDLALARLHHIYRQFDTVAVAFSGGKDSTACLQLTLQVARELGRLPLEVVFFDEEAIPYETEEYVRRVAQSAEIHLRWYCLPIQHRNACSRSQPYWWPWAPEAAKLWCRPLPPEAITELAGFPQWPQEQRLTNPQLNGLLFPPAQYGNVGMVMGIRALESIMRTRAVTQRSEGADNYIVHYTDTTSQGNLWKCYPIYDWHTADVWTAPNLYGWDYNHAYDLMEQAGVPQSQQRCSPAFGEEPLQKFWTYRLCFPAIWDQMSQRVPGANTAMRYAQSDLYGYGSTPDKPDDMTWQEFLLRYITKHPPAIQAKIRARLAKEITAHYAKTTDPILNVTHPLTGVSWHFLLRIAIRGDLKGREQALKHVSGLDHMQRLERQYAEALTLYQSGQ